MSLDTQRTGQIGVNVVERIVLKELKARWQPIDAHNDDGTDGLIFLEDRNGNATGQIIFVQIKCWKRNTLGETISLNVAKSDIKARFKRWSRVAGSTILVWVNPDDLKAYWTNLQDNSNYSGNSISINLKNEFNGKSIKKLKKITGTLGGDNSLPIIECSNDDLRFFTPTKSIKIASKEKYKTIKNVVCGDPRIGDVKFGRVGWKHITRKERPISRITQSLQLLAIAEKIVKNVDKAEHLRKIGNEENPAEIYGLTAKVVFPHRDAAVIRVILLRQLEGKRTPTPRTWFYSIYERRRKRGIRGENTK